MKSGQFDWWALGIMFVCVFALARIQMIDREQSEVVREVSRLEQEFERETGYAKAVAFKNWGDFVGRKGADPRLKPLVIGSAKRWAGIYTAARFARSKSDIGPANRADFTDVNITP